MSEQMDLARVDGPALKCSKRKPRCKRLGSGDTQSSQQVESARVTSAPRRRVAGPGVASMKDMRRPVGSGSLISRYSVALGALALTSAADAKAEPAAPEAPKVEASSLLAPAPGAAPSAPTSAPVAGAPAPKGEPAKADSAQPVQVPVAAAASVTPAPSPAQKGVPVLTASVTTAPLAAVASSSSPSAPAEPVHDEAPAKSMSKLPENAGVQVGVRTGLVRRSLAFKQDVYGRMRSLGTNLFVARADAAMYPPFQSSALSGRLGFVAGYERALAGSVHDADYPQSYSAFHSEVFGGLRLRHPVRKHELGFDLTIGRLESGLRDDDDASGTPDVAYTDMRGSLDCTLDFERVRVTASAGFRAPLGYGQITDKDWFPRVSGYGLEASALAKYLLTPGISLDLSVSMRRFVLEMNSEPQDAAEGLSETAGGAVDAYFGGYVGMTFAL